MPSSRGLSVALIDRGDFGGGTSFNSLKTLHGGLRSLQALNLEQMRRFIRERRALARIVPHLVRPLPYLIPTTHNPKRSRAVMRLALALNDIVARDRNEGVLDPALHLPAGQIVSRDEALRLNPFVAPDGVTGGAVWHDYQMANADRVTFSFTLSAAEGGATVANYVRAESFLVENGRVTGAQVNDVRTGSSFAIRGRRGGECGRRLGAGAGEHASRRGHVSACSSAVARDERRAEHASRVACLRRRGGRPLPVPGSVARRLDAGHQPRRARRPSRCARLFKRRSRSLSGGGPRRIPARLPRSRGCAARPSRPAADAVRPRIAGEAAARERGRRPRGARRARARLRARRALHHRAVHSAAGGGRRVPVAGTCDAPPMPDGADAPLRRRHAQRRRAPEGHHRASSRRCPPGDAGAPGRHLRHRVHPRAAGGARNAGTGRPARPNLQGHRRRRSSTPPGTRWR